MAKLFTSWGEIVSFVAIVSGIFSSGRSVAEQVAQRLEYTCVNDELLTGVAAKLGVPHAELSRAFSGWQRLSEDSPSTTERTKVILEAAMAELVSADNLVCTSPAIHLIPAQITHVLRVCLIGDREFRVALAAEREGLDPDKANEQIVQSDQRLTQWTHRIRGLGPWDAALYDVKIPMRLGHQAPAVDVICEALTKTVLRPTAHSIEATLDFLLSTQVNLALLRHGQNDCSATAQSGDVSVALTVGDLEEQVGDSSMSPNALDRLRDQI